MQFSDANATSEKDLTLGSVTNPEMDPRTPQLALPWTPWTEQILSSLRVAFFGPKPLRTFSDAIFFRDGSIERRLPLLGFSAALVCHAMLILFPFPIWNTPRIASASLTEVSWDGPLQYLPPLAPKKASQRRAKTASATKPSLPSNPAVFHPRQTIVVEPLHPAHPRQTLLQARAPIGPPKILPVLPNIVQLSNAQPTQPKLQLSAQELKAIRPAAPTHRNVKDVAAPEITPAENQIGVIDIASARSPIRPTLSLNAMSAPHSVQKTEFGNPSASELPFLPSGTVANTLIALSAAPAPIAPPAIPAGNLSARISVSPEGTQSGSNTGDSSSKTALPGGGHGPDRIFVSSPKTDAPSPIPGLVNAPSPRITSPARPALRSSLAPLDAATQSNEGPAVLRPGISPEAVLGAKRVYTLEVNMPNLTSASGSWVLNFAELNEERKSGYVNPQIASVAPPIPLRKVDPKYPPQLRDGHVEGEVVLYAVIRKDGTVDSIQLVRGIDRDLDANAMEALAQWKFKPGEKHGAPVDLEAVVHIPFRSRATNN